MGGGQTGGILVKNRQFWVPTLKTKKTEIYWKMCGKTEKTEKIKRTWKSKNVVNVPRNQILYKNTENTEKHPKTDGYTENTEI